MEKAAEYLKTINTWAQVRRGLTFRDARGHVLREADTPLKFPISGSNDVVLALRQYVRQALLLSVCEPTHMQHCKSQHCLTLGMTQSM